MLHSIPGSRGEGSGPPWSPSDKQSRNNLEVLQIGQDACLW